MKVPFRITLKAARINSGLNQGQVAKMMTDLTGIKVTRYRIMEFEKDPKNVPKVFGEKLAKIYKIPMDYIFFDNKSTLSLRSHNKLVNNN